ncbi:YdcF family protein [Bacteroidota bacterium]
MAKWRNSEKRKAKSDIQNIRHWFCRIGNILLLVLGFFALIGIILAFTSAPFWIWYGLGASKAEINGPPDYIIVLGGSGIPSESGLMRTYYAGVAADYFPDARVIVALPGDTADSVSSINRMWDELSIRGIAPERIMVEDSGTNTRAQALLIRELITKQEKRNTKERNAELGEPKDHTSDSSTLDLQPSNLDSLPSILDPQPSTILLITSPEHLYRAVLTFRKAGFDHVDGMPAFGSDIESDITFSSKKLGGRRWIPDVGESITLRYQFWTQLQYEILILREWMAIAYYWVNGWI